MKDHEVILCAELNTKTIAYITFFYKTPVPPILILIRNKQSLAALVRLGYYFLYCDDEKILRATGKFQMPSETFWAMVEAL